MTRPQFFEGDLGVQLDSALSPTHLPFLLQPTTLVPPQPPGPAPASPLTLAAVRSAAAFTRAVRPTLSSSFAD